MDIEEKNVLHKVVNENLKLLKRSLVSEKIGETDPSIVQVVKAAPSAR